MVAILLSGFTLVNTSVRAGVAGTSQGVTLVQLGCGTDSNGNISGPYTSYLYGGYSACSNSTQGVPTPVPSGTLYHMRVVAFASAGNASANLKVSLFTSASRKPVMVCAVGIPRVNTCNDLIDTAAVNAGDTVWATISIPDS